MDSRHRGGYVHPPRGKNMGTTYSSGHTSDLAPDWPEGSRALGRESLLHAPRDTRGSGLPVPHPKCSEPGGGGMIMPVAILSSRDCGLAGARNTGGGQSHTPG